MYCHYDGDEHNADRFNRSFHALNFFFFYRAIDLTQRHPQYLEVVVGYRQKYLKDYGGGKKETNPKYIQAMKSVSY
jgi:hypothetical protein